jgi:hypothetical protein
MGQGSPIAVLYDAAGNVLVGQLAMGASVPVVVASDQSAVATLDAASSIAKGRVGGGSIGWVGGSVATSAATVVSVRATTYTEPPSAQQMRLVSSSALDTAAGTGCRSVRVTYYDNTMTGPLTEVVTLNGTTAVNMVATTVRFIEKLEAVLVGSGGTNAGIISIQNTAGSTTFGTIAATDGQTFWAHHYVATGKVCCVNRVSFGASTSATSPGGSLILRTIPSLTANAYELQLGNALRVAPTQSQQVLDAAVPPVSGPARLTLYFRPDGVLATTVLAGFSFYEL